MSSPEDSAFVKDAYAELNEMDLKRFEGNERVSKFLSAPDENIGIINYGGAEIKFRLFLSKSLRHKMLKSKVMLENANDENALTVSERTMYDVLGQLCVEEPYNSWQFWAYVDEKSTVKGGVQGIFIQMLVKVTSAAEDVKNFRNK